MNYQRQNTILALVVGHECVDILIFRLPFLLLDVLKNRIKLLVHPVQSHVRSVPFR